MKNECPGGGSAVNVSPAEAERPEYHCPQCGRWIKFRKGYAGGFAHSNGGWPTPYVPRHSATVAVKIAKDKCGKLTVDDYTGDDGWCKRTRGHKGKCKF